MPQAKSDLVAGTRLGRYEIRSKLGEGGMGEVYLAQDTELGRKVALKILPADLAANEDRMRRFVQEAKAAAALNHPNIAHIYEIGISAGVRFIALEYVPGESLRHHMHRKDRKLSVLLKHLLQVAEGLAKAHAEGIVHRDLKPDNVIITPEGYAKILDFGLAKLLEQPKAESLEDPSEAATLVAPQYSTPGMIMGTVGYMSPEQARGEDVDQRSDIFSFGCLLYEATTARKPFKGDSTIDSLHKIIYEPAPAITDFNPAAPPELQRIIRKCLIKARDKRYQAIRDAATDLEELLEQIKARSDIDLSLAPSVKSALSGTPNTGETALLEREPTAPTPSHAVSSAEYVVSEIKRHKIAAVLVVLALGVATVILVWNWRGRNTEAAIESIAVLPFENQNRDPELDYLSDGITESIINKLAQLPELRVIARTTVFRYKGQQKDPIAVAKELGVRSVLVGRLMKRGDDLIVSAEFIDVRDNKQIWGEQYTRSVSDALAVQQEISRRISERLRPALSGEEHRQLAARETSNPEAYQFYLKGRYYWNKRTAENLRKAMEQFQYAADKDPNYALAYAGLADCHVLVPEYVGGSTSEAIQKAIAFAQHALQFDDSLAAAHTSLGYAYENVWQWQESEKEFKRAIELDPNYPTAHQWYALLLRDTGRVDQAIAELKRAQELDPLSRVIGQTLASVYITKGDVNSAVEEARRVIDLDPSYPRGHDQLGLALLKQGKYVEAMAAFRKAVELSQGSDRRVLSSLAFGCAVTGNRVEALALLHELQQRYARQEVLGRDVAAVYAGLGDKDQALAWLEKDFQSHSGALARTRREIQFESLHNDPRFLDLFRRMGLQT
ncbi:MAG TPA: protein kinase [Pyrinomonadaceae bacterium]|nr:protein kinase [Pyrinomonadaceae bacterium]